MRAALFAIALVGAAGCNQLLGISDVHLDLDAHPGAHPDAMTPDAPGSTIDAAAASNTSLIAVLDLHLIDPTSETGGVPFAGGVIHIELVPTGNSGIVVAGTTIVDGCLVVQYDAAHPAPTPIDGSDVTISGNGLVKPVGTCSYQAIAGRPGYYCVSGQSTGAGASIQATAIGNGQVNYTILGISSAGSAIGSYLDVGGLTSPWNSGAQPFPVIAQTSDTITVFNGQPTAGSNTSATGSYHLLNGYAPLPIVNGNDPAFLSSDVSTQVHITKNATAPSPSIDATLAPVGGGFTLDGTSADPGTLPASGDVRFACGGTGGACGTTGATGTVFAILATTTNADVSAVPKSAMPPGTIRKTMQCGFLNASEGIVPADALAALRADGTTRIEMTVGEATALPGSAEVVVGHGVAGHTDL